MTKARKTTLIVLSGLIAVFGFLYFFTGVFGETRINLTLTTNPDLERGLQGHWTFDGGDVDVAANQIVDRSKNANQGSTVGMNVATTSVPGAIGQAFEFDGIDDRVVVSDSAAFNLSLTGTYTWSAWIRPDGFNEWSEVFAMEEGSNRAFYFYAHTTTNGQAGPVTAGITTYWESTGGGNALKVHSINNVLSAGDWNHITVTYDGSLATTSRFTIYVNGTDVTDTGDIYAAGTLGDINPVAITIGRDNYYASDIFDGGIDDVRFYDRILSAAEVKRLYELGATTKINQTLTTNPDLERGLLNHFTFDGGGSQNVFTDSGSLGEDGYMGEGGGIFMATTTAPGVIGQALYLDGTDQSYLYSTTTATMNTFTVCTWFNMDQLSNEDGDAYFSIVSKWWDLFVQQAQAELRFTVSTDGTDVIVASKTKVVPGNWYHVCGIHHGVGTAADMYVNGVEDESTSNGGNGNQDDDSAYALWFGAGPTGGAGRNFPGRVDDVRIYDRALSAAEIQRLYELGATTHINETLTTNPDLENGLVGHWTFDGAGILTQVTDRSGNGNVGYFSTGGEATSTKLAPGKIGQGIVFDGTDDYIAVTTTAGGNLDADTLTLSTWFYPTALPSVTASTGELFQRTSGTYGMFFNPGDDSIYFYASTTGGDWKADATPPFTAGDLNSWHHIVGVYDGSEIRIYVDNVEGASPVVQSGPVDDGVAQAYIGSSALSNYLTGALDDVRIYNRALSAAEIKRLYELGK